MIITNKDLPKKGPETLGKGEAGGKAEGLKKLLKTTPLIISNSFSKVETSIPPFTILSTEYFDRFMGDNQLWEIAFSDISDERKARKFISSELPADLSGQLWKLNERSKFPLAVRSSSLLEDMKDNPLAGIYSTQMVPNNQLEDSKKFLYLTDAIKLIYASTFSKKAISYMLANNLNPEEEKMAVIIQKVAGEEKNGVYYPDISGVAKSWNYYPGPSASPSEGIVQLAIGLGKTIVEGENTWNYSPVSPAQPPPFNSIKEMIDNTQREIWAINMKPSPNYVPFKEDTFLIKRNLSDVEYDNRVKFSASTWDMDSDIIRPGVSFPGPRVVDFKSILDTQLIPLNEAISETIKSLENSLKDKVEIEFAMEIDYTHKKHHLLQLLQVRPMKTFSENVSIDFHLSPSENILLSSKSTLGNGTSDFIKDIVFLKPENFDFKHSQRILTELEKINYEMVKQKRPYLLIGFGRWGSSDPWLGLPADWEHISGAKAIVEVKHEGRLVEFSQGSHFFHNLTNLKIVYFNVDLKERFPINWSWLNTKPILFETDFIKTVELESPLTVKVDGNKGEGVILTHE